MNRRVGPQFPDNPLRQPVDLLRRIVLVRHQQGRQLGPDVRVPLEVDQRIENRLQVAAAEPVIEFLGERLQIHVRRIHVREELLARAFADVAGCHGDGLDVPLVTFLRHIHGVFQEDNRVVVRESDAPAAKRLGGARDGFGRRLFRERFHLARTADVPVLAELAGQVAAGGPERQDRRAGKELVERLLLDRVHAEPARPAVRRQHHSPALGHAHEAPPALAVLQFAVVGTHVALDPVAVQLVPELRRNDRTWRIGRHISHPAEV